MKEIVKHKIKHNLNRLKASVKWVIFAILSGLIVGGVGTLFYFSMEVVTLVRTKHPEIIFLLPVGGIVIVGCYRLLHDDKDTGTNLVLSAIHSGEKLPLRMAPLIFISTLITHLFGGSAGREGAALQLGGSIGNGLGRLFRFDEKDKHIMIMCGMSAAFSTLFGTPMAAAIFSMEVVSVGIMYYAALVPCVVSSLVAHAVASSFGISPEAFPLKSFPAFQTENAVLISILAVLCAGISILFCILLHQSEIVYKKLFKNPYLRVFAGGCMIVVLTLFVGDQTYNGTGMSVIAGCMKGSVPPEAFLLKMVFTALTLGAGYKGGEIVPAFFIGAALGCAAGPLLGLDPGFAAAVGLVALFCGVVNCPVASIVLSVELFGGGGLWFFALACGVSYLMSGYYTLYAEQHILYAKLGRKEES